MRKIQQTKLGTGLVHPHGSHLARIAYSGLGIFFLILAGVGVLLPIVPTTPFILLSATCFARSSTRLYNRLLANSIAGPIIHEWFVHRSMRRRVKHWVYFLVLLSFSGSILMMPSALEKGILIILGVVLIFFIWRIPVRDINAHRIPD
ncbi:MAG: YbaN family protein [Nitrosospira sp.]|nr:YbaN family protein [Nitrosospira sp.]MSQ05321.1 DUF454 domain-containing protein [Nitrosomonadaceae bacterium]MBI0407492.1 YbaN family protein [Nitrosospira sp.]MBI0414251.1 YbaN family protein [Nitrosospira sp.]MBI0415539.1 YbaN family protein [Nitrosospira sp.]